MAASQSRAETDDARRALGTMHGCDSSRSCQQFSIQDLVKWLPATLTPSSTRAPRLRATPATPSDAQNVARMPSTAPAPQNRAIFSDRSGGRSIARRRTRPIEDRLDRSSQYARSPRCRMQLAIDLRCGGRGESRTPKSQDRASIAEFCACRHHGAISSMHA